MNSKATSRTESQVSKPTVHLPSPPPHLSVSWTAAVSSAKESQRSANGSVWGLVGGLQGSSSSFAQITIEQAASHGLD